MSFFRDTTATIYYSHVTRKELIAPPISDREKNEILAFLQNYRLVNADPQIADGFSTLLNKYTYLKDHLADALIAATAWKKGLELVTTNPRHFAPIEEIKMSRFPEDF
ncbi:MAG: type II toxin-antitoxin system VapC family toxin [Deltaproteobacteria bacterium]|nr:type II toxin-antitoxin system VapC family toxin [Deltaproteobacteria bacterium]